MREGSAEFHDCVVLPLDPTKNFGGRRPMKKEKKHTFSQGMFFSGTSGTVCETMI